MNGPRLRGAMPPVTCPPHASGHTPVAEQHVGRDMNVRDGRHRSPFHLPSLLQFPPFSTLTVSPSIAVRLVGLSCRAEREQAPYEYLRPPVDTPSHEYASENKFSTEKQRECRTGALGPQCLRWSRSLSTCSQTEQDSKAGTSSRRRC